MEVMKSVVIVPPKIRIQVPEVVVDSGSLGNTPTTEE